MLNLHHDGYLAENGLLASSTRFVAPPIKSPLEATADFTDGEPGCGGAGATHDFFDGLQRF